MDVGERIELLMEKRGWNQLELSQKVDINKSVLNRIINGSRRCKDYELAKFADVFEVSTDYLLGRTDIKDTSNISYAAKDGASSRSRTKEDDEEMTEKFRQFLEWQREVRNREE
ncbi:helix-turn-helix domain-containing protein [Alkalihalophilus pseudofirmus]|uniref:helix-turn-helix domain-containing protein n=1 Tax=Alkalihalophilus pseudofirmus TaxID=79885 RepID=UPI0009FAA965